MRAKVSDHIGSVALHFLRVPGLSPGKRVRTSLSWVPIMETVRTAVRLILEGAGKLVRRGRGRLGVWGGLGLWGVSGACCVRPGGLVGVRAMMGDCGGRVRGWQVWSRGVGSGISPARVGRWRRKINVLLVPFLFDSDITLRNMQVVRIDSPACAATQTTCEYMMTIDSLCVGLAGLVLLLVGCSFMWLPTRFVMRWWAPCLVLPLVLGGSLLAVWGLVVEPAWTF